MKKKKFLIAASIAIFLIIGLNFMTAEREASAAVRDDPRNNGISVHAYYRFGVMPGSLVFDIWSIDANTAPLDIMRIFFDFAQKMKDRNFTEVRLAYRGETRFILPGSHFRTIGEQRSFQNPLFVINNLPANLQRPDGSPAFSTWTGGFLGVAANQIRDFETFYKGWFWDAEIQRLARQ